MYMKELHPLVLDNLVVATDDDAIFNEVKAFNGNVIMTKSPFNRNR